MMTPTGTPTERFWRRVDASGDCWEWTGGRTVAGYGWLYGNDLDGRPNYAHRFVWVELVGPIPDGYEIDHLCKNRGCVNPDHLEPVTPAENKRRSPKPRISVCRRGHPLTPDNLYQWVYKGSPGRQCRACALVRADARHQRLREANR